MSWGSRWGQGPAGSGDPCAGSRSGRVAETGCPGLALHQIWACRDAPPCALLWSAGNAARAVRDRKWQVRGPGRIPRKDLPKHVIASALWAASPYLLRFFYFSSAQAPLQWVLAHPGPKGFPPSLPSSALVLASAQGVEPSGDASGWKGEGQGGPAHLGGAVQIRLRLSLSWRGSCLVCPYRLRVTLSLLGGFEPQLLRPHPRKSHGRSRLCAGNRS